MKRSSLLFGTLLLVACGGTASSSNDDVDSRAVALDSASTTDAYERLTSDTNANWQLTKHALFGTTSHLEGRAVGALAGQKDGFSATLAFLEKYKDLFGMKAPALELQVTRERVDSRGYRHVRMQQIASGLRVVSAEMLAHFDKSGALVTIDARYVPNLDSLALSPTIDKTAALSIAILDAQRDHENEIATPTAPELVVFANGKSAPALAYYVRVRIDADRPYVFVYEIDAKSGVVLNKYDDVNSLATTGKGVKGDTKNIEVSQQGSSYVLIDTTRTANNITTYSAAQTVTTPGELVSSESLTSWDTNVNAAGSAVDAHFNAGVTYDYYKQVHARTGIDGKDAAIISTVHFSKSYDNAFWDGQQMIYGDGDGTAYYGFAAGLDVVGHELTHGVTQSESKLDYQDQSGALNESISDIMGCFVEHNSLPDPVNNWLLGEAIGAVPTRSMIHPSIYGQPGHMSEFVETTSDYGGVHINSGIPNNADYLMTMGGTNDKSGMEVSFGIGWEKAQTLWYLVNTEYLASGSDFVAGAQATLSAAKGLGFTQNEQNIVQCAWIAVGVLPGACKTLTEPAAESDNDSSGSGTSSSQSRGSSAGANGDGSDFGSRPNAGGCSIHALATEHSDRDSLLVIGLAIAGVLAARRRRESRVTS